MTPSLEPREETRRGLAAGLAAYACWGVVPIFWRQLHDVAPVEILAHRSIWALACFGGLAGAFGVGGQLRAALQDRRALLLLAASAALLAGNWLTFLYAVASHQVVACSLGYFINPLVNVLLGTLLLGERLAPLQRAAIALATAGVAGMAWSAGGLPWISLALGFSFALYGLLRKVVRVDAIAGSVLEMSLLFPFALAYLIGLGAAGEGALGHAPALTHGLLLATGLVTAVPLLLFTAAARRLPLSTIGFLQYLTPTGQLLTAVYLFREPFAAGDLLSFSLIWAGLAVFSLDLLRRAR